MMPVSVRISGRSGRKEIPITLASFDTFVKAAILKTNWVPLLSVVLIRSIDQIGKLANGDANTAGQCPKVVFELSPVSCDSSRQSLVPSCQARPHLVAAEENDKGSHYCSLTPSKSKDQT